MPAAASCGDIFDFGCRGGDSSSSLSNEKIISSPQVDAKACVRSSSPSLSSSVSSSKPGCVMFKGAFKSLDRNSPFRNPSSQCRNSNQDDNGGNLFINYQPDQLVPSVNSLSMQPLSRSNYHPGSSRSRSSNKFISMEKQSSLPLSSSYNSRLHDQDHSGPSMNFYFRDDSHDVDRHTNNDHHQHHNYDHHKLSGSVTDFDTSMLLYDGSNASDRYISTSSQECPLSPLSSSLQQYLSIEELKASRISCWLCGCNWQQDHITLDCPECGGYALTRPCPKCDGKCNQIWRRNLSTTHDSHKASWTGQCSLSGSCGSMETRTDDLRGSSIVTATILADQHAKIAAARQENRGKVLSVARRSSSCCSSVASSDSEL